MITYLSGVLVTFILGLIQIKKIDHVHLSDLLELIVYSALSWASLVYGLWEMIYDWMILNNHDIYLWSNHKN